MQLYNTGANSMCNVRYLKNNVVTSFDKSGSGTL